MDSYLAEDQGDPEVRTFFRCPIEADAGAATIKFGFKKIRGVVFESSVAGYGVMVKKADARKLKMGKTIRMHFDGAIFESVVIHSEKREDGYYEIGLRKTADLTPPEPLKKAGWFAGSKKQPVGNSASIAFGGFVLVLFCAMALPGLGDSLGTADRIESAFQWFVTSASAAME